jgi:hypothetical protein
MLVNVTTGRHLVGYRLAGDSMKIVTENPEPMDKGARSVATALVGLVSLAAVVFSAAAPAVARGQPAYPATIASSYRNASTCPCMANAFFESLLNGEHELAACTNNSARNFVRLVASNFDLIVLFEFSPQLFCGWQPALDYTSFMPVTAKEFKACKHLIIMEATRQGIPCLPELSR